MDKFYQEYLGVPYEEPMKKCSTVATFSEWNCPNEVMFIVNDLPMCLYCTRRYYMQKNSEKPKPFTGKIIYL